MIATLFLPDSLRAQIHDEARAALPRECCGLMEGSRKEGTLHIAALHPARNLAEGADRFEIDSADHFAAVRAARANGGEIVGCYHSHPDGIAKPSGRDRTGAVDEDFLWLICAGHRDGMQIRAFVFAHGEFHAVDIVGERKI